MMMQMVVVTLKKVNIKMIANTLKLKVKKDSQKRRDAKCNIRRDDGRTMA